MRLLPLDDFPTAADDDVTTTAAGEVTDNDVIDVSRSNLEIALFNPPLSDSGGGSSSDAGGERLYVYGNNFYLVPGEVGRLKRLKTFKFFANSIGVLPPEAGELGELERLQVKVGGPAVIGEGLRRMKSLRELELCMEMPRLSGLSIFTDIVGLDCLTKLSVCNFGIRYIPPEISCLKKLEELDLSFNKLKTLPSDITKLSSLKSLRVGNNKLTDLPSGLSLLKRLENLDVSNNRLTTLTTLNLDSMHALQYLNLQHNKFLSYCQIPPRICCNFEGTGVDISDGVISRPVVEVGLCDMATSRVHPSRSCNGCPSTSSCSSYENPLSCRQRKKKGWKRRDSLQQRARDERLNSSRMRRGEAHSDIITVKMAEVNDLCESVDIEDSKFQSGIIVGEEKNPDCSSDSHSQLEGTFGAVKEDESADLKDIMFRHCANIKTSRDGSCLTSESASSSECYASKCIQSHPSICSLDDFRLSDESSTSKSSKLSKKLEKQSDPRDTCDDYIDTATSSHNHTDSEVSHHGSSSHVSKSAHLKEYPEFEHDVENHPSVSFSDELHLSDKKSSHEATKVVVVNAKRHCENNLDINPIRSKCPRSVNDGSRLSWKYSNESFCSIHDHIPDGFYDAGRSRPFLSLEDYERRSFDSREVILLDRKQDEELDAIVFSAEKLLSTLKRSHSSKNEEVVDDNLQRASVLALFVSDCFGGSDRSASIMRTRRAVIGLGKQQPFVCTCSGGIPYGNGERDNQTFGVTGSPNFTDMCEESIRFIRGTLNSNVVPLGTLRFGICRHRAVLMKYLCDRADPPIPCELVRGFLDFTSHAWNAIHVRKDNRWVRMVVDACCPTDIREETDVEYFCRYIPLNRLHVPIPGSFTPPPWSYEIKRTPSGSVMHYKLGSLDAAMKVRTLDTYGASDDDIRSFECAFLGEVRIMGALRNHNHITEIYGHQLSCKWVSPNVPNKESRLLRSVIFMEYIRGDSLKCYLQKLLEAGEKYVPIDIALCVAKDVASALVEMHSKHIIHRDVKSENILIDLDCCTSDGSPLVKLTDFDRSVPLHSSKHTCCIAHLGVHPPNVCVGTPRWMAPEVAQAMHQSNHYGLEVDIWSYGCVLLELLTLQIPYTGFSDVELYHMLQMKQRPRLTPELEALRSEPGLSLGDRTDIIHLLVDLFYKCTEGNPADRPSASYIFEKLCAVST